MEDRELLELAAKAAEIGPLDFDYASREKHSFYFGPRLQHEQNVLAAARHRYWNPLAHDRDALRMAVKLNIEFACFDKERQAKARVWYADSKPYDCITPYNGNKYEAVRRVIVLAAAEIGKAMP